VQTLRSHGSSQFSSRDLDLIKSFAAGISSLEAALGMLNARTLPAVLRAWQLHTCAATSAAGYSPTVYGQEAQ
jgi:hypothetical protein